jgi:hypothetical protein
VIVLDHVVVPPRVIKPVIDKRLGPLLSCDGRLLRRVVPPPLPHVVDVRVPRDLPHLERRQRVALLTHTEQESGVRLFHHTVIRVRRW